MLFNISVAWQLCTFFSLGASVVHLAVSETAGRMNQVSLWAY
jgi:hypothetical protein